MNGDSGVFDADPLRPESLQPAHYSAFGDFGERPRFVVWPRDDPALRQLATVPFRLPLMQVMETAREDRPLVTL